MKHAILAQIARRLEPLVEEYGFTEHTQVEDVEGNPPALQAFGRYWELIGLRDWIEGNLD
jgi:hypothetical protein